MLSISLTEEGIFFLKSSNFSLLKLSLNFWISLQWFKAYSLILMIVAISIILTDASPLGLAKSIYYSYAVRWDGLEILELNQVLIIAGFYPWRLNANIIYDYTYVVQGTETMRGSSSTVYVPMIALVQRFYYHLIYSRLKHSVKKSFNQFTFLVIQWVKKFQGDCHVNVIKYPAH